MAIYNKQLSPPKNWQDFERMCHSLWMDLLGDLNIELNGRIGQAQCGVDVYGKSRDNVLFGIQCKGKDYNFGAEVTEKELRDEVNKAKQFEPPIDVFILATTAQSDAKIQKVAREIEAENKKDNLFDVKVFGWEEICQRLTRSPQTIKEFFPEFNDRLDSNLLNEITLRLRSQNDLTTFFINELEVINSFITSSLNLSSWKQTLLINDKWIFREQEEDWFVKVHSSYFSTTVLLGEPGTGKSALLARITQKLQRENKIVFGIKADKLSHNVHDFQSLSEYLKLSAPIDLCIKEIAKTKQIFLIFDQLDALSDLIDVKTNRLSVLLDLIYSLQKVPNIHIIVSSRPFEFRFDNRLRSIESEIIELPLLSWSEVQETFDELEIKLQFIDDDFKRFLQRPSNLNFYLKYITDNSQEKFKSHIELYEHIWKNSLGDNENRKRRANLLISIASEMTEDAKQSLPVCKFEDNNHSDIDYLCDYGILVKDFKGRQLSFAHQTLQAFVWTRSFVNQGVLSDFVYSHQNNLNIRPKLNTILVYLRDADPSEYKKQIQILFSENFSDLRKHILFLLIETICANAKPRDEEVLVIAKLLQRNDLFLKVCQSLAQQSDWFELFKQTNIVHLMNGDELQCHGVSIILSSALKEKHREVIELMNKYWRNDKQLNNIFQVLRENLNWETHSIDLANFFVLHKDVNDYAVQHIVSCISATCPNLAPKIAANFFNKKFDIFEIQLNMSSEINVDDLISDWKYVNSFVKFAKIETVWHKLSEIAKASPKEFICAFWPYFGRLSKKLENRFENYNERYIGVSGSWFHLKDNEHHHSNYLINALEESIRFFACQEPKAFIQFVNKEKISSYMPQHRLIAMGLREIIGSHPIDVFEYLIEDDRRFFLGDSIYGSIQCSLNLISRLFPALNDEYKYLLECKILSLKLFKDDINDDVKIKKKKLRSNRRTRQELLSVLSLTDLTDGTKKYYEQEVRLLGKVKENLLARSPSVSMIASKSPMSLMQMEKASIVDIVRCFEEFKKSDNFDNFEFVSSLEHARTLGELSKINSQKALDVINVLSTKHSSAVEFVIRELSVDDIELEKLQEVIISLSLRGFDTDEFHQVCSRAILKRIVRPFGLSDKWCKHIESWIFRRNIEFTQPDQNIREENKTESILWNKFGQSYIVPNGNFIYIETISYGLLFREIPQYKKWIDFLLSILDKGEDIYLWEYALVQLIKGFIQFCEEKDAIRLFEAFEKYYPSILENQGFGVVLAQSAHWMTGDVTNLWLNKIYSRSTLQGYQLFGEILGFKLMMKSEDKWCTRHFEEQISHTKNLNILVGLAYSVRNFWEYVEYRTISSKYFVLLLNLQIIEIDEILCNIFYQENNIDASPECQMILDALIKNKTLERIECSSAAGALLQITNILPEMVFQLSEQIINFSGQDLGNIQTAVSAGSFHLVTIAITLHNLGPKYQSKGLDLFEKLLEYNTSETSEIIFEIDSRPRILNR